MGGLLRRKGGYVGEHEVHFERHCSTSWCNCTLETMVTHVNVLYVYFTFQLQALS